MKNDFNMFNTIDHILRILDNPPSFFAHIMLISFIIFLKKSTNVESYSNSMELITRLVNTTNIFNERVVNNGYYQEIIVKNSNMIMDFIDNSVLIPTNPSAFIWNYLKRWLIQYLNNPINYGVFILFHWLSYRMYFSIRIRNFNQEILANRLNRTQERIKNPLTKRSLNFFLYFYSKTFPILSRLLFRKFK